MKREGEWEGFSRNVRVVSLGDEDGDIFKLDEKVDAIVLLPGAGREGISDCEGGGLVGANRWLHRYTTYRGEWTQRNASRNGIHDVMGAVNGCKYVYVDHTLFARGSVDSDVAIKCLDDVVKELASHGVRSFAINGRRVNNWRTIQFAINRALHFVPNEIEVVYLVDKNNGFGDPGRLSWDEMCVREFDSEERYNDWVRRNGFSQIVDVLLKDVPCIRGGLDDILKDRYMLMLKNFTRPVEKQEWGQAQGYVLPIDDFPDARLVLSKDDLSVDLQGRWQRLFDQPCIGVDLPVWLQERDEGYPRDVWENTEFCPNMDNVRKNRPRIMIVSQDPLRSEQGNGCLSLSSPFGLHCGTIRDYADNCISLLVKKLLVDLHASVYITDANKLYLREPAFGSATKKMRCYACEHAFKRFCEQNRKKLISYARETQESFREWYREILEREISMFSPTAIITMGKVASGAIGAFADSECGYDRLVNDCPVERRIAINGCDIPCFMAWHPGRKRMTAAKKVEYFLKAFA